VNGHDPTGTQDFIEYSMATAVVVPSAAVMAGMAADLKCIASLALSRLLGPAAVMVGVKGCLAMFRDTRKPSTPGPGSPNGPPPPKKKCCDDLLADWIDSYLQNFVGVGGKGSPLWGGLSTWGVPGTSAGHFLVGLGEEKGVDPAFVLGIARAESTLAQNTATRGGIYNVYGNRAHFSKNLYTNYRDPTVAAFSQIQIYIGAKVPLDTTSMYANYEGEKGTKAKEFTRQLGALNQTDTALFGNLGNVTFNCDDNRRQKLASALGVQ
jgi:hypothetical protein